MWHRLARVWNRSFCNHSGPKKEVHLGRALPGVDNPVYTICLNCGAVNVEDKK